MHWNAKSCAVFVDLRGFLHYKMAYVIKYVIKMGHNFPVLQLDAQLKNYSKMVDYSDDAIFPILDHSTAKQYWVIMNLLKRSIFYNKYYLVCKKNCVYYSKRSSTFTFHDRKF